MPHGKNTNNSVIIVTGQWMRPAFSHVKREMFITHNATDIMVKTPKL